MNSFLVGRTQAFAPSNSATNYNFFNATQYGYIWGTTELFNVVPFAVDVTSFYVEIDVAPGSGKSWTFKVRKNGADTGATVTISNTSTSGTYTGSAVSFAAGDKISISSVPSGTPAAIDKVWWNTTVESASAGQPLLGQIAAAPSIAVSTYMTLCGGSNPSGTENNYIIIAPTSGTLSGLRVLLPTAPGTGKSWTITVRKNGSAAFSLSVADTNTTGYNSTDSTTIAAGDTLSIQFTPFGSPTGTGVGPSWGLLFTPDTNGENILGFSSSTAISTSATNYNVEMGYVDAGWSTTESSRQVVLPASTLKKMYLRWQTAPGSSKSYDFTVRKNTADTSMTVNSTGTSQTTGNITVDVSVSQGDKLSLKSVPTSTPTAPGYFNMGLLVFITQPAGGSSIKTVNGLAKASVKTVNGLAIASVKTWNGLA